MEVDQLTTLEKFRRYVEVWVKVSNLGFCGFVAVFECSISAAIFRVFPVQVKQVVESA